MINVLVLLFSFLVSFLTGFFLVRAFFPFSPGSHPHTRVTGYILGIGGGIGVSSLLYFLSLITMHPGPVVFLLFELIVLAVIFGYSRWKKSGATPATFPAPPGLEKDGGLSPVLVVLLVCSLAVSAGGFIYVNIRAPLGSWDAWAIWNLHAQFIVPGNTQWASLFTDSYLFWTHPDYPLLIPAFVARGWGYMGMKSPLVPIAAAFFFTFGSVGLMYSGVSLFKGKRNGVLAVVFLIATSLFIVTGANQNADAPLAFYILSVVVLLALHEHVSPSHTGFLVLAGVFSGFAGWTKNEGLLYIAAFIFARIVFLVFRRRRLWKECGRELLAIGKGLLPVLAVVIYFKKAIAPAGEFFQLNAQTMEKLFDIDRYLIILREFFKEWFLGTNGLPVILILFVFLAGRATVKYYKKTLITGGLILLFANCGLMLIYVITPYPLEWHLLTSLNRLVFQMVPALIFIVSLAANPPGVQPNKIEA